METFHAPYFHFCLELALVNARWAVCLLSCTNGCRKRSFHLNLSSKRIVRTDNMRPKLTTPKSSSVVKGLNRGSHSGFSSSPSTSEVPGSILLPGTFSLDADQLSHNADFCMPQLLIVEENPVSQYPTIPASFHFMFSLEFGSLYL